jgi:hypothetical protein
MNKILVSLIALAMAMPALGQFISADSLLKAELARKMNIIHTQIIKMIADPSCRTDASCKTIGFGSICGNPKGFLVYSDETVDFESLLSHVEYYNSLESAYRETSGQVGNCQASQNAPQPPDVICSNYKCVRQ